MKWITWSKLTPILYTQEGHESTIQEQFHIYERNWSHTTAVFVSWSFSLTLRNLTWLHSWPVFCHSPFFIFKCRISRVVFIWDVADKSNWHLMHNYPISKKIVNVTNNIRAIKALWVIKKSATKNRDPIMRPFLHMNEWVDYSSMVQS